MKRTLELWGGAECTVNRVGERYFDQLARTGHESRIEDLDLMAGLGVRAVRFPILWERAGEGTKRDEAWAWTDARMHRLRDLGVRPIVGLVHHGSGPAWTDLTSETFVEGLALHAALVAARYPWVTEYTPVNEPMTTARFSGLYGHWYPHGRSDETFVRSLLIQTRATIAAMRAIRRVTPAARLLQTEDIGTTRSTRELAYQATFDNHRRCLSLDLLFGLVVPGHPLHGYLLRSGATDRELGWIARQAPPPDTVGINYYLTSDRYLDHRVEHYPPSSHGGNGRQRYADVETVRVAHLEIAGYERVIREVWDRYRKPVVLSEVHLGCTQDEQVRWLAEAWIGAQRAREGGADVRAVTLWSMFGAYDWNSLVTRDAGHYEPGVFDVSGGVPFPTALAELAVRLGQHGDAEHRHLGPTGWWRRAQRALYHHHESPILEPST